MYINTVRPSADSVFYSRRANGPYYRWSYEETRQMWQSSRLPASNFGAGELGTATWKSVPDELKDKLCEHYLE